MKNPSELERMCIGNGEIVCTSDPTCIGKPENVPTSDPTAYVPKTDLERDMGEDENGEFNEGIFLDTRDRLGETEND